MLNNKGFAVSSVLYTLLIAFLLFLGAALAQFSTSSSLIGKANDDIVNGTQFDVMQVKSQDVCKKDIDGSLVSNWYESNTIVRIKSRYGTKYWPKDFAGESIKVSDIISSGDVSDNGKIKVTYTETVSTDYENFGKLTFTVDGNDKEIILVDICQ